MSNIVLQNMTRDEASQWKSRVGTAAEHLRGLLAEGYEKRAWEALGHANWTECVQALAVEFAFSERHLWRLHVANQTEALLTPGSVGEIPEKVLRPLTSLPPEQQAPAYEQAIETAPDGKVTAAHVQAVVNTYKAPTFKPEPDTAPDDDDWDRETPDDVFVQADFAVVPATPPTITDQDDRDAARLQAEAEAAESDRLMSAGLSAIEGAHERIVRKELRATFFQGMSQATKQILSLDPDAVADALSNRDADTAERFFNDCRRWFASAEEALRQPLRAVK